MELINNDCLVELHKIKNNSIDLILTSPPYNIGKPYDESIDLNYFINAAYKCLKENGVFAWQVGNRVIDGFIFPIDIETHSIFKFLGFNLINRVVWHFEHGLHCKKRLSGRYETILFYSRSKNFKFNLDAVRVPQKYPNKKSYKGPNKGKLSGNPLGKNPSDIWIIPNVKNNHPEKTKHPCQFPEVLTNRVIKLFTNENDIVIDPFMGSGTVGVSCKKLNRNFIGIENNKEYFEIAKKRINKS